jgi:hypothetical protein
VQRDCGLGDGEQLGNHLPTAIPYLTRRVGMLAIRPHGMIQMANGLQLDKEYQWLRIQQMEFTGPHMTRTM